MWKFLWALHLWRNSKRSKSENLSSSCSFCFGREDSGFCPSPLLLPETKFINDEVFLLKCNQGMYLISPDKSPHEHSWLTWWLLRSYYRSRKVQLPLERRGLRVNCFKQRTFLIIMEELKRVRKCKTMMKKWRTKGRQEFAGKRDLDTFEKCKAPSSRFVANFSWYSYPAKC